MARIDDSHAPFKRTTKIGPGPKKREPITHAGNWECERKKPTATHYIQSCRYVGMDKKKRGKKITVKTEIDRKTKYNKQYRKWAKKQKRIQALVKRTARGGYKCRKTVVAKCKK